MAFDMRGHGDSTTPAGGYRVSRLAADLRAVIERLALDEVDLMGHSIGSSIIWSYIDLFGEDRLGRFVFVDQAPSVTAKADWSAEDRVTYGCLLPDLNALAEFYLQVLAAETAEATVPVIARLFSPSLPAAELLWFARARSASCRAGTPPTCCTTTAGSDWRDVIKTVRRPTLVVGAEASIFSAEKSQRWIADQIPGARGRDLQGRRGRLALHVLREPDQVQRAGGRLPRLIAGRAEHYNSGFTCNYHAIICEELRGQAMQFQDFVADQVFSPTLIADELRTTKARDCRHAGTRKGRSHAYRRASRARKTQVRLRQMLEILNRVEAATGSPIAAYAWFRAEPLPGFGGATPDQLVREGRAEHVHAYLDRIMAGGYA